MSENQKRILEMLKEGKISVDEATKLLSALDNNDIQSEGVVPKVLKKIKYLRVLIDNPRASGTDKPAKVNVRVPVSLIRAGMKFTQLMPHDAAHQVEAAMHEKGINFNLKNIKDEDIDDLIDALRELEVDIDGGQGKVRVYAE